MFFFRDITPIGLNIAIGASESKKEYKNLHMLIGREFSEEVVLLSSEPHPKLSVAQYRFTTNTFDPDATKSISWYTNPDFVKRHNQLRKEHDDFEIKQLSGDEGRSITPLITPFRVRVKYHSATLNSLDNSYFKDVVFTINPHEFGVEVIWLCQFLLREDEYIIDGEFDMGRNYLVRQPVILIDMEFLKNTYYENKSLGLKKQGTDIKVLPLIPEGKFIIFDQDIALRKRRLINLNSQLKKIKHKPADKIFERDRIKKWLDDYEMSFANAKTGSLTSESLRSLCPVTWKTLELIIRVVPGVKLMIIGYF